MEKVIERKVDFFLRYSADLPAAEVLRHLAFSRYCPCQPEVFFDEESGWHTFIHNSLEDKNMKNEKEQIQENMLYAESVFGRETKRGFVRLSVGISSEILITPEEARFFAMSVLEAAQAAETDEILMQFLQNKIGIPSEEIASKILADFRNIRIEMRRRELKEAKEAGTENKI